MAAFKLVKDALVTLAIFFHKQHLLLRPVGMEALEGGQVAEEPCHIAEQIPQDHSAEMSAEDAEAVDAVLGNVDILKLLFNQLDLADLCRQAPSACSFRNA